MPPFRSPNARRRPGRALPRPLALRSALAALLVLTAVGLAACGGSSSSASSTPSTAGSTTTTGGAGPGAGGAAFAKYTTCLKQHGVTLPTRPGGFGGGGGNGGAPPTGTTGTTQRRGFFQGANSAKFRAAQTACSKLLPANFRRGGFGGAGGTNSAAFAAYRNCLSLHGVKIAAGAGGFGRPGGQGQGTSKPNAKMTKALAACAALRPTFTRRPPSSTTPAPTTSTTS